MNQKSKNKYPKAKPHGQTRAAESRASRQDLLAASRGVRRRWKIKPQTKIKPSAKIYRRSEEKSRLKKWLKEKAEN